MSIMKKITKISFLILTTCLFLTACQEESEEPAAATAVNTSFFSSFENRKAFTESFKENFLENTNAKGVVSNAKSSGAHFIAPFFSSAGEGVIDFNWDTGDFQMAFFSGELSESDFYRENPDGTVTVHVNMNSAFAEYIKGNFFTGPSAGDIYLYGNNAHYSATYTGPVVEQKFYDEDGNLIFSWKYIDTYTNTVRGYNIKGNGKVGENGVAPLKNLSMKVVQTSSGQSLIDFSLK